MDPRGFQFDIEPPTPDAMATAAQAIVDNINSRMFDGGATYSDAASLDGITDDLINIAKELKARPPVVTAIWFVDREDIYHQFLRFFGDESRRQENGRYFGIPLYRWLTHCVDTETEVVMKPTDTLEAAMKREGSEKRFLPWICNHPGVWMHWSNGNWTQRDVDVTSSSTMAAFNAYCQNR
jgi:hypothetical protein